MTISASLSSRAAPAKRLSVREFNVYRWAGRMLADAGHWRLRQRIEARVQRLRLR